MKQPGIFYEVNKDVANKITHLNQDVYYQLKHMLL